MRLRKDENRSLRQEMVRNDLIMKELQKTYVEKWRKKHTKAQVELKKQRGDNELLNNAYEHAANAQGLFSSTIKELRDRILGSITTENPHIEEGDPRRIVFDAVASFRPDNGSAFWRVIHDAREKVPIGRPRKAEKFKRLHDRLISELPVENYVRGRLIRFNNTNEAEARNSRPLTVEFLLRYGSTDASVMLKRARTTIVYPYFHLLLHVYVKC
jgi:transcription elongation GreA/GreB family factor